MCRVTPLSSPSPSSIAPLSAFNMSLWPWRAANTVPTDTGNPAVTAFSVFPLPLWFVVFCLTLLPSYCFVDRGYTQWFLWGALVYGLTRHPLLPPFLAIQGLLINAGWYLTLVLDYHIDGRFLHILYRNMPISLLSDNIINGPNVTGQEIVLHSTLMSYACQLVCFLLDLAMHPLLCYYFWYQSYRLGKSFHEIVSWTNLCAALLLSKTWSILHNRIHYDQSSVQLYYYGDHVYIVPANVDHLWTAAYVGEALATIWLLCRACPAWWRCAFPLKK